MTTDYENKKLWRRDLSRLLVKSYLSVPTKKPGPWRREHRKDPILDVMIYTSGEYEIRGHLYGTGSRRRSYTVWRLGVELPLLFTGSLRDAKLHAVINAAGRGRMNVA